MPSYVQGKEVIDSPGYGELITLDENGRLVLSTTHTQGTIVSVTNTPGSAGNPNVLKVDAQSSNWTSIASACVQCDADDTDPYLLKIEQAANTSEFMSLGAAGSTYCTFGIGGSDQLLMQTTSNDMIQMVPHGNGYSYVGDGTKSVMTGINDNLFVSNDLEVDGTFWVDDGLRFDPLNLTTEFSVNVGDDFSVGMIWTYRAGMIRVQAGDDNEWMEFRSSSASTLVKESGSANTNVNVNPDGALNAGISGSAILIFNRLGSTQKLAVSATFMYVP